jgi:hypothetical protein
VSGATRRCSPSSLRPRDGWYRPSLLVSDTTLETTRIGHSESGKPLPKPVSPGAGSFIARHPWWLVALGVVVFSALLVRAAGTRPGYDPYGWLVWGYQTLHVSLDLGGAPSWKPFTWLFTVPYALFGHHSLQLWMTTSVATSLAGCIFAGRIAYRLTNADPEHRYAAIAAGVFAGVALLLIQDYMHYMLSVQSDPMLVTVVLAAIDCQLSGHPRWAFALGVLAALGRPEAWPFVGIYAIWAWRAVPSMRWFILAGLAVIPVLWFGVPTITNGRPDIAGQLALASPRELHGNKVTGTIDRFTALSYLPIQLAGLLAFVWGVIRRDRAVIILGLGAIAWVAVEIAFVLHGWPGVPRYLFEPAGVMIALSGVAVGWLLLDAPRIRHGLPAWVGVPVVALLVVSLVPGALARERTEHKDLLHEQARTVQIDKLAATVTSLGGYRHVLACGRPVTNVEFVAIMAWYTRLNTGKVGHRPQFELRQTYPIVLFTPLRNGWAIKAYHTPPATQAACANMDALYVPTARHPRGVLVPK